MSKPRYSGKRGETLARLWANTEKTPDECWLWLGAKNDSGYPYVRHAGRMTGVHRLVYALTGNPLHPGDAVNHRCHQRACINPAHLNAASTRENSLDALQYTALTSRISQLESTLSEIHSLLSRTLSPQPAE